MTRRDSEKPAETAASTDKTKDFAKAQEVLSEVLLHTHFQSEEYQTAMRLTFETRARVGTTLGNFLLDHPLGRFLVKSQLVSHPIIKQRELQEQKIHKLAERIHDIKPQIEENEAQLQARLFPEFQPRTPEQIVLDTRVDYLAHGRRLEKYDYDANRDIDYSYDISPSTVYSGTAGLTDEQKEKYDGLLPRVLMDRKTAHLRQRFYKNLADRDWPAFIELVVAHYRKPGLGEVLEHWIVEHRDYIFPNEHFRLGIFRQLMTILIVHGHNSFEQCNQFWQKMGLDLSDEQEKKQLSKTAFPYDHWYELMNDNSKRYFELQRYLNEYGICP